MQQGFKVGEVEWAASVICWDCAWGVLIREMFYRARGEQPTFHVVGKRGSLLKVHHHQKLLIKPAMYLSMWGVV
jgi:hypothetical protein